MVSTFSDVAQNVANVLKRHPAVAKAEVFGSFARGEQTPESDIDILIEKKRALSLGLSSLL